VWSTALLPPVPPRRWPSAAATEISAAGRAGAVQPRVPRGAWSSARGPFRAFTPRQDAQLCQLPPPWLPAVDQPAAAVAGPALRLGSGEKKNWCGRRVVRCRHEVGRTARVFGDGDRVRVVDLWRRPPRRTVALLCRQGLKNRPIITIIVEFYRHRHVVIL
jgi:hypothetical protein